MPMRWHCALIPMGEAWHCIFSLWQVAGMRVFGAPLFKGAVFKTTSKGTWCCGIASASHAEGPGFKSQCVHGLFYQAGTAASSLPMGVQLFDMCFSDSTCVLRLRTWLKAVAAWDARGAASIPAALRCQPCAQAAHPVQACRRMACWMAHRPHTAHLLRPGQCISAL